MERLISIILAAGKGTRMKSKLPKVLHQLLGRPMLQFVIDLAHQISSTDVYIVIGYEGEKVIESVGKDHQYIWQKPLLGTGHAIMMCKDKLAGLTGDIMVLYGDTPLLSKETLLELIDHKHKTGAQAAILTTFLKDPSGYGRIIRDANEDIKAIVEDKDASDGQKKIKEVNTGVCCFTIKFLLEALEEITPRNAQGEYYLTDVFEIFVRKGLKVTGLLTNQAEEVMGPNDRQQLAYTENFLKMSINRKWMSMGVTIEDPNFTYIGPDVELESDSVILPGTILFGKTCIGENCIIGPHTRIIDSNIGSGSIIEFSQVIGANLGRDNRIGPFAYLRPGTVSETNVKIGDFVEIKNTSIGKGTKIPHLSYIGDASVEAKVNIGAGTITCNYDGVNKHRTIIKEGVFIGSNSNLVAPVTIGPGATIGAGSTITDEVPEKALAIARNRQSNILHWKSPKDRNQKES